MLPGQSGLALASPLSPVQNFFAVTDSNVCAFMAPSEIRIINVATRAIKSVKASSEQRFFHAIEKLNEDTLLVATGLVTVVIFIMDAISKGLLNLVYSVFKPS